MSTNGSGRAPTLHPVLAVTMAGLGWLLMQGAILLLARAAGLRIILCGGEAMLALPMLLALAGSGIRLSDGLALAPIPRRLVWTSVLVGVCFWVTSAGLLGIQSLLWPPSADLLGQFRAIHAALRPDGLFDAALSVLAIAIAPAVCEEVVFRGAILPSLLPRVGPGWAIAISAVLFGLIHDPYRLPFAIAIGVGLGIVRLRSGSLVPSTLAHATVNTITFVWGLFVDSADDTPDTGALLACAILAAGLAASVAVLRRIPPRGR